MISLRLVTISSFSALLAASGLALAEDRSADFGISGERGSNYEIMSPGNGLSLSLGSQRAIAVFETEKGVCQLKLVLSGEQDTQIVVPVLPGSTLRVDSSSGKSAAYACGEAGDRMDARLLEHPSEKS